MLQPGDVGTGDPLEISDRPHGDLTIARLLGLRADPEAEPDLWDRLAGLPELSESWRQHFARRVSGESDDDE